MKHTTVVLALASFALASLAQAQSGGMKGMDMQDHKGMDMKMDKKGSASGTVHKGTGKVTKIDAAAGSVTIAHEPVASMSWPAMTMSFKVKDKKMLDKAKSGEKVDFSFVQSGRDYTLTDIKSASAK